MNYRYDTEKSRNIVVLGFVGSLIELEQRFIIYVVVNFPWTPKNSSPLTELIIDQIPNIKDPHRELVCL